MNPAKGVRVQKGVNQGALHRGCTSALPYVGNAPCSAPASGQKVHHDESIPQKRTKLVLSPEQTAILANGDPRFSVAILHPGSWPENPGRMLLDLIEVDSSTANALLAVIRGEARIVRKSPQKRPRLATSHPRANEGHSSTTDQSQYLQ